jgi:hypothetical protein
MGKGYIFMVKQKQAAKKAPEKKTPAKKAPAKKVAAKKDEGGKTYHIAKRASDGKWQVKLASGEIAIKLFDTQAEAIEYAKKMAENQNGSIRVHSMKGKMRKV